ncbi:hypothetical protein AB0M36_14100 [Actinoplanes sp. NPDC051346]|uniref:hypothetical protein n=1 Tax=Actinoplanes sp. NPDC051346 TaxID=3155048 RepID=UPI00343341E1
MTDRGMDALRVLALVGVVVGDWLMTAAVLGPDGVLRTGSLVWPGIASLTWVYFFAEGFANGRAGAAAPTGATSVRRLVWPVVALVCLVTVALIAGTVAGAPERSLYTAGKLAVSPLWPAVVLAVLTLVARPARWLGRHPVPAWIAIAIAGAVAVVAAPDAGTLAAYVVPYLWGQLSAADRLGPRAALTLTLGGVAALVVLVGADPPSLMTMALGAALVGAALLARPALARWLSTPGGWRPITALNRAALPLYLWHQSVLVVLTVVALQLSGGTPVPGLHTSPDGPWLAARLAWLPVLALGLVALVHAMHPFTRRGSGP